MKTEKNTKTENTINSLNVLLSNFQLYYQNLRGFHWNIKGPQFFELHVKFEEFYNDTAIKIDDTAERILTLGGVPLHTFEDYLKHSEIKSAKNLHEATTILESIWESNQVILSKIYETIEIADDNNDEGTQDLLSPMVSELEKTNWMVGAYLNK